MAFSFICFHGNQTGMYEYNYNFINHIYTLKKVIYL